MNQQVRTTLSYGSGKDGMDRAKLWNKIANDNGYDGVGPFIREAVDWIIRFAVWKKGQGVVGIRNPENTPEKTLP